MFARLVIYSELQSVFFCLVSGNGTVMSEISRSVADFLYGLAPFDHIYSDNSL